MGRADKHVETRSAADLLDSGALREAADCLRTMAHPLRLRMLELLMRGRFNVGQLAERCGLPSHMASEHLRLMQHCGLLRNQREGRCTYYEIAKPRLVDMIVCIENGYRAAADE